MTKSIF